MATEQELKAQEKRELQRKDESTIPARTFVPTTDIYETDQGLTVVMEMPGVDKAKLDINVENDVLSVEGRIDFSKYEKLQPVYTEYNIGHYRRTFSLAPNRVDQGKIKAEMTDGVLTLTLPKAEQAQPRRITVE
ncbi:Molecular chaperone IbpA, HSP20 family [Rhizobiales bacterium GAS188]|nr:Molecular chaperone IbpA, HSP20 family [Rhizobiales bacterium GAS188]